MFARRVTTALLAAAALLAAGDAAAWSRREPSAEEPATKPADPEWHSVHFQLTTAAQYHPKFAAKYSGKNSLRPDAESATALVSTLYLDLRLWKGAEFIFNPEMSGGRGLSRTLGVAAFPSGIVYRVGDPSPAIYLARLAIRQSVGLGGGKVINPGGANELAREIDRDQLTFTIGRVSVTDVFNRNRYASDPTDRFFNWALFAAGAWDYPADTRGYTWGVFADLSIDWWSARAGIGLEPKYANLREMEWRVDKARGLMIEYEARYSIGGQPGAASLLLFHNTARMGSYAQVVDNPAAYGNSVQATREHGRTKYGFALSVDQQLRHGLGAFLRLSANDGRNESWAFTEIDRNLSFGFVQRGELWARERDAAGVAVSISGLSPEHRAYLAGGGSGFILGDGALNYGPEVVTDIYYKFRLHDLIALSAFYQPIINPGYNRDRGPVHVFTGRLHATF